MSLTTAFAIALLPLDLTAQEDEEDINRLEEVTVTATRRDQSIFEIPLSITAFTGEELETNLQDDLADYFRTVPGVTLRQQSSGLNTISIRGISGGGGQRAKAPVSFYIDDMPVVSDPVASPDIKTFDIERVEVLRGPQGTLFGESALGGVIRVISKQPDLSKVEGKVRASYLDFAHGEGGYTFDGMFNAPVVEDTFAIRASVSRREEGGWIDNLAPGGKDNQNDLDYTNARLTALWQVNDNFSASATAYVVRSDYGGRQFANEEYEQTIFVDETRHDDIDQFNITLKYDFSNSQLTSSTNWFERETFRLFDLTPFFGFLPPLLGLEGAVPPGFTFDEFWQTLGIDDQNFSQELRLTSTDDGPFRWTTGLYYFDTDNFVYVDFQGDPSVDFDVLRLRRDETYTQEAVFAELEYDLSDKWTVIGGLRYTDESRRIHYDQQDDWTAATGGFRFLAAVGMFDVDIGYSVVTPKLVLQYRPVDNVQVYASATKGFRGPGGNTDYNNNGVRLNVYDAEVVWSYELGSKLLLADNRVSLEIAGFFTDWEDRQEVVNPGAPFNEQYVSNIGTAEIRGIEVAASFSLTKSLTFGGQVSYLDTEITESGNQAWVGLPITGEPEWRGSLFADYYQPINNNVAFRAHVNGVYSGDVVWSLANPVEEGDYTLWNANMGLVFDRWNVDLFMRNVGDEFIAYGAGLNVSVGEPRSYGVSMTYNF